MSRPDSSDDPRRRLAPALWRRVGRACLTAGLVGLLCAQPPLGTDGVAAAGSAHAPSDRPNIVLVLADDLSKNLLRYMPHVRAMERAGVSFTNYVVSNSLCCPSRASLLTGNYPHDTGIFENLAKYGGGFQKFRDSGQENSTIATTLRTAGYRTGLFGKYLNGYAAGNAGSSASYVPPGWSEWDVTGNRGYWQYRYLLTRNRSSRYYGDAPSDYLTSVLLRRAIAFISSATSADAPFFVEFAPYTPHWPDVPAPQDVGRFPRLHAPRTAAFDRLPTHPPPWLRRGPLTRQQIRRLDSEFRARVRCVQSLDRAIARLEGTLRASGVAQHTIFVFTSDNGLHLGDYRLRGGKMTAFDIDIRVPLIVTGPGIPGGRRVSPTAQNVDLAPTFTQLAGDTGTARTSMDGRSLVPLLRGRHPASWPDVALVEQHLEPRDPADPDYPGAHAAFPPDYRAITGPAFTFVRYPGGFQEYYNRRQDPAELHNIAGSLSSRRLSFLHRVLRSLAHCTGSRECSAARRASGP